MDQQTEVHRVILNGFKDLLVMSGGRMTYIEIWKFDKKLGAFRYDEIEDFLTSEQHVIRKINRFFKDPFFSFKNIEPLTKHVIYFRSTLDKRFIVIERDDRWDPRQGLHERIILGKTAWQSIIDNKEAILKAMQRHQANEQNKVNIAFLLRGCQPPRRHRHKPRYYTHQSHT